MWWLVTMRSTSVIARSVAPVVTHINYYAEYALFLSTIKSFQISVSNALMRSSRVHPFPEFD
jgi:hypothetical protein